LGDHARFLRDALAPKEQQDIAKAKQFVALFDSLLETARAAASPEAMKELNQTAIHSVLDLRSFKLSIIERKLKAKINISLPPSFINHMVNELEEYARLLQALLKGEGMPSYHPVHHHLLWLQDGFGHAAAISGDLDFAEKDLIKRSKTFEKQFTDFYIKAVELAGYLRTNLKHFPALSRFNKQTELEMKLFQQFLDELEEMRLDASALGTLTPLMADHMFREECYYLNKLAQSTDDVETPPCNPEKPRVQA
jgi:hypothetical protein